MARHSLPQSNHVDPPSPSTASELVIHSRCGTILQQQITTRYHFWIQISKPGAKPDDAHVHIYRILRMYSSLKQSIALRIFILYSFIYLFVYFNSASSSSSPSSSQWGVCCPRRRKMAPTFFWWTWITTPLD